MIYTLLLISAASTALSNSLIKLYRRRIDDENVKDSLYYILMIAVALVIMLVSHLRHKNRLRLMMYSDQERNPEWL